MRLLEGAFPVQLAILGASFRDIVRVRTTRLQPSGLRGSPTWSPTGIDEVSTSSREKLFNSPSSIVKPEY